VREREPGERKERSWHSVQTLVFMNVGELVGAPHHNKDTIPQFKQRFTIGFITIELSRDVDLGGDILNALNHI
jgi:hypothetical protein